MESDFQCGLCQKQFMTVESVLVHRRRNHRTSKFVCHHCSHKTNFKFALKKHIERVHLTHKLVCHNCNYKTNFKFALKKHIKRVHLNNKLKKPIKWLTCPLCNLYKGGERNGMIKHYTHVHDVQMNETTLRFNSYEDFSIWKTDTELRDSCQFISVRGVKKTRDGSIQYLRCSRDGFYRSARKGKRRMKLKGSVKIDAVCPSSIKLQRKSSGPVEATYVGTHVGHTCANRPIREPYRLQKLSRMKGSRAPREEMVSMSSTLVETVSINYEDFNESFLTCGTCLCMYDGGEHTPKLLPCSHTVCLHCLSRIAAQVPSSPTFRCPICRESITVPRGGVAALPPSFLVNQLLDLMASQRREVVPKCSVHITQELLFCETCDTVFCGQCTSGSHSSSGATCEHTVIPFSIAIKRMSEILLYKANECISKLTEAEDAVKGEVNRLESASRSCLERVESLFTEAHDQVEARRLAVVDQINRVTEAKMKQLNSQLATIQAEKEKVTSDCDGLQYQVEVRNISQRIQALSSKLESVTGLSEPRENCFIACEAGTSSPKTALESVLKGIGRVKTTTTFPSLSGVELIGDCIVNLETTIILTSYDYEGVRRCDGGDPVRVNVVLTDDSDSSMYSTEGIPTTIDDRSDGTYHIKFRPPKEGSYNVQVNVVDRPVGKGPLIITATKHNNPVVTYGTRGSDKDQFFQPVAITYDKSTDLVYVVDTGNCRIKVLSGEDLSLVQHIENSCLVGRSCTGVACWYPSTATSNKCDTPLKGEEQSSQSSWLVVVNWRTKTITRLTPEGMSIDSWTYSEFVEPIDVAVDPVFGHILVADNGPSCVFVFDELGKFLFQVGSKGNKKGCFNQISSVTVGSEGQIVVADSRIQVFSAKGDFLQEFHPDTKGKGKYGGLAADDDGRVLGSKTEKGRSFIQVVDLRTGQEVSSLDSNDSKLKRPSGVTVVGNHHAVVVDLGNDCVKKYRYW